MVQVDGLGGFSNRRAIAMYFRRKGAATARCFSSVQEMRFSQRHGKAILRHRNKRICEDFEESDGLLSASHEAPARPADRESGERLMSIETKQCSFCIDAPPYRQCPAAGDDNCAYVISMQAALREAIARMAFYLSQAPGWKPDRATAAQIRQCSACKSWKSADSFSPQDHLCRPCRKELSRANRKRKDGRRTAQGRWSV